MRMRPNTPPTTPPAIAPTLVFLFGVALEEGEVGVAVRELVTLLVVGEDCDIKSKSGAICTGKLMNNADAQW